MQSCCTHAATSLGVGKRFAVWSPMIDAIPAFEERHANHEFEMVDERCPEHITERTAAFQLASRVLQGEAFRLLL